MQGKSLFITGTDTDVGKTFITALIGGLLVEEGYKVGMSKPLASGALQDEKTGEIYSEDAKEHIRLAHLSPTEAAKVNQICLRGEFSPKIAAKLSNVDIDVAPVLAHIKQQIPENDYTLIEGAGGITTPISDTYTFTEFAQELKSKVLIISDGRLGSINRAVLTAAYAKQHQLEVIGIIVNDQDDTDKVLLESNLNEIELYTHLPILAVIPRYTQPKDRECELTWAKNYLSINKIIELL